MMRANALAARFKDRIFDCVISSQPIEYARRRAGAVRRDVAGTLPGRMFYTERWVFLIRV